jgi:hypothetical protein
MMVREEDSNLHLLSAVSPEWIGTGKQIAVERAPTPFGTLSFTLEMPSANAAVLSLNPDFSTPPHAIVLHLPWFMETHSITADGVAYRANDGLVTLPASTRVVKMVWQRKPGASAMSYAKTVGSYTAEYRRRYEHLLATGEMSPAVDTWRVPE